VFLQDRCIVAPSHTVQADVLFIAWTRWCDQTGRKWTGNVQEFGRDLRAVLPQLEVKNCRIATGERKRFYEGIDLDDFGPDV
jgi:hypothetical protein